MGIYWSLFVSFFKVGLFGYGGGPAFVPLIEREVVANHHWLTAEEFIDAMAMSNTLPGPISTKLAVFVGMKVGGYGGAATAISAMLLPSTALIVAFTIFYQRYKHVPSVQGIVRGVRPVVIALLMVTVANLAPKSVFSWDSFVMAFATFIIVFYLKVHPIFTIMAAAAIGLWFYR